MTKPAFEGLQQIIARIESCCHQAQRDPRSVQLVMVSKTVSAERLSHYLDNPHLQPCVFGENKAQELKSKAEALKTMSPGARWHFIGHLQSNKIKDVLPYIDLLHSLDRLSLAQKLHQKLLLQARQLPVLIQVNAAREDSKSGVLPEQALEFLQRVNDLPQLQIQGFMTIGAHSNNPQTVKDSFQRLADLREQARELTSLRPENQPLPHLSMGMSGDFEWAIEAGATLIRVGSAIFGDRQ